MWLQEVLTGIRTSVDAVAEQQRTTNENVIKISEAVTGITRDIQAIHKDQQRIEETVATHEDELKEIRDSLRTIAANQENLTKLADKVAKLEQWKVERDSSWTGPRVVLAAVVSILPIIAAVYGVFEFFSKLNAS